MPIKNYTTTVKVEKTTAEILRELGKRGADAVQVSYSRGEPTGISFRLEVGGRPWHYQLPARPAGVLATLKRDRAPRSYQTPERAAQIAWRILREWLLAQFALIDAGAAELGEVFLPFLLIDQGTTIYQRMLESPKFLGELGPGGEVGP